MFRLPRFRTGSRPGGKKAEQHIATDYLDTALSNFSGYIAADELYDGPFCVLSIVDNHNFQRLVYEVLDIKELTKAVLRAVAKVRKELKVTMPNLGRGRPSKNTKKASKRKKRIEKKITDLFDNRYLFVKHHLTASEKRTLKRITRGLPHLRTLRDMSVARSTSCSRRTWTNR